MPQNINPELKAKLVSKVFRPAAVYWNRLEGRPRTEDFDRTLRVEVRDPLWMLCRQWQFGEFKGEDAGSAVQAKVQLNTTRLNRYAARTGSAFAYDDNLPLETKVEREAIFSKAKVSKIVDLSMRVQMGRHWLKVLNQFAVNDYRKEYLNEYAFEDPADMANPNAQQKLELAYLHSDLKARQWFEAVKRRVVDGYQLLEAIQTGEHEAWVNKNADIPEKTNVIDAATAFAAWFERIYNQPQTSEDNAWAPSYLEYQFTCSAPADPNGDNRAVLVAQEYYHGHLDWYSVDIDPNDTAMPQDHEDTEIDEQRYQIGEPISFIPTQIEYSGMPNVRWWEFEDRKTEFGNIRASTSDIAHLMLAEFGLIYGNDWSVLPYNLEVGSLCEIQGLVVTDVFGVRTFVRPAGSGADEDWQRWNMYNLSTLGARRQAEKRLFLPPALSKIQEGSPIEKVILTRDEVANMVWGIEDTIPGVLGIGSNGYEAATDLINYLQARSQSMQNAQNEGTDAKIQYKLGTSVPENWIPFIPVRIDNSRRDVQLQRAAMPRLNDHIPNTVVEPRGVLLRTGLDLNEPEPYFINEEEVRRVGLIVTQSFQRTRWYDGKIYSWIGRRKQTGRGEGSSSLEFDQIVPMQESP
jgi:hypothetical protein